MAETWYRINPIWRGLERIEPVQVERATESCVYLSEKPSARVSKYTSDTSYYPTWDRAWCHLREMAERSVESARGNLQYAEARLAEIHALRERHAQTVNGDA